VQKKLIYGIYGFHQSFALLPEDWALEYAAEVGSIQSCRTVGEARLLLPMLKHTWMPGDDFADDEGNELGDEDVYNWADTTAAQEGDWPPMPDGFALDRLPGDLLNALEARAGAEVVATTLNGDYFAVPAEREADLLATLADLGYQARRDDSFVDSLGMA
jgi:hypothetical protein